MSLSIANLSANLKEHLADNEALFSKYFTMMDNDGHMRVYEDVIDKQPLYELDVTDPGQPGNRDTYAPKANVLNWKNRTLEVKNGEVTLKLTQQEIEALHKTHLAKVAAETRRGSVYDVPFEEYMMQRVLMRLVDRIESILKWKGALNASGTTTADIANGFLTFIAADITSEAIPANQVFAGAAITVSNAEAQMLGVLNTLATTDPEALTQDLVMYVAPENAKFYWENYRAVHGALPYNDGFQKRFFNDMPNIELIPQVGLSGSDRVILTPRFNLAIGSDALERIGNIEIEKRERAIHVLVDFKIGFNYGISKMIWTNDQA